MSALSDRADMIEHHRARTKRNLHLWTNTRTHRNKRRGLMDVHAPLTRRKREKRMRIAKYFKDITRIIGGAWKRGTFLMLANLNLSGVIVGFLIGFAASSGAVWWQWGLLYAAIGFMLARALFMARLFEDDEAQAFNKGERAGRAEGFKEGESQHVLNQIAKIYGKHK